jgi:hypothetical protein
MMVLVVFGVDIKSLLILDVVSSREWRAYVEIVSVQDVKLIILIDLRLELTIGLQANLELLLGYDVI